jgi:Domain of unknown function (DUF5666)
MVVYRFLSLPVLALVAQGCLGQVLPPSSHPCDPTANMAKSEDSLDLPPLAKGQVSLIGGTVSRIDPIRDRMVLRAFGGRNVTINFDVRTCVMHGDSVASMRDVKPGTRLYADTILNDGRIFARTIRVATSSAQGESKGQISSYDPDRRILRVRDAISSHGFSVQVTANTDIRSGGQSAAVSSLTTGTLVDVHFRPGAEGTNLADKIEILAQPGGTFTFAGTILSIDMRNGYLTLIEPDSQNTFDVGLSSVPAHLRAQLKEGVDVTVNARFDGTSYQAQNIQVVPRPNP